jgi:pSer/pThr/pTyr-binding forkhead associated (FHA) protein
MSEKKNTNKSGGADWFVQGILARIGDIFDKLTGRGWQKSSSLSASELVERLKLLLDSEVRDLGEKGKFVPHNIKLKMQWNKFSTDSPGALKTLEYELLAAAIDHINDNLYHTYKPFKIEIKPDYFTDGIKFLSSFGEFGEDESEAEVEVSVPQMKAGDLIPEKTAPVFDGDVYIADFTVDGKRKAVELKFSENRKRISVGRTKENDLFIDDASISKTHASLVINPQKMLLVADTGSTNGTFINGNRIAYGRAFPIGESDKVKFGNVEVFLRRIPNPTDFVTQENYEVPPPTIAVPADLPPAATIQALPPGDGGQSATEAFQLPAQRRENLTNNNAVTAIPKIPDYGFDDERSQSRVGTIQPPANVEPEAPLSGQTETELNPTEPGIKLKFDE